MNICIYCKEAKPYKEFNKEHVIPKAFGHFNRNLTLIQTVCKGCNSYFSQEIELFLARDSLDGIMRYKFGLSKFSEEKKIKCRRLKIELADHGDWQGTLLEFSPSVDADDSRPDVILLPQVGFYKRNSEEKVCFALDELSSLNGLEKMGLDTSRILLIANDEAGMNKAKNKASKLGFNINKAIGISKHQKPKKGEIVKLFMRSTIDNSILRAIAKITFNYLAYTMGDEFVLESWFDEIREYIRYGTIRGTKPVRVEAGPILYNGNGTSQRTEGHLITLDWGDQYDLKIIARVSLFNRLVYHIILCRHYRGLHQEIRGAHFFDLKNRTVRELKR
jgi:hypothetical protein